MLCYAMLCYAKVPPRGGLLRTPAALPARRGDTAVVGTSDDTPAYASIASTHSLMLLIAMAILCYAMGALSPDPSPRAPSMLCDALPRHQCYGMRCCAVCHAVLCRAPAALPCLLL